MARPAVDLDKLTRDERLSLLEEVWESLNRDITDLPFTPEQEEELDRRLDSLDREGAVGISADDLQKRLRDR